MQDELISRLERELEELALELTVDIPLRLGEDHRPEEYAAIMERQRWVYRRIQYLRGLLAELPRPPEGYRDQS